MKKRFKVEIEFEATIYDSLSDDKSQMDDSSYLIKQFIREFVKGSDGLAQFYANYFLEQFLGTDQVKDDDLSILLNYQKDNCQAIFLEAASRCPKEVNDYIDKIHQPSKKDSLDDRWKEQQLIELDNYFEPLKVVNATFYPIDNKGTRGTK
jgi:hypothetical protein